MSDQPKLDDPIYIVQSLSRMEAKLDHSLSDQARHSEIQSEHGRRIDGVEDRVSRIETQIVTEDLPTQIKDMGGRVKTLEQRMWMAMGATGLISALSSWGVFSFLLK